MDIPSDTNTVGPGSNADITDHTAYTNEIEMSDSLSQDTSINGMANCPPALTWLLHCFWAACTYGGMWDSYFEAAMVEQIQAQSHDTVDPIITPEGRPSIFELMDSHPATTPRVPCTVCPVYIPPTSRLRESLRVPEHQDVSPSRSKHCAPVHFDQPSPFDKRIGTAPTRNRGVEVHPGRKAKIRQNTPAPQISADEADIISRLALIDSRLQQRERDRCRRYQDRRQARRESKAHRVPAPIVFTRRSSSSDDSSSSSEDSEFWPDSNSDVDDVVSETSQSVHSSSGSHSSAESQSRRLSPPPGRGDRLMRMQQHQLRQNQTSGSGLVRRLIGGIASLWSAA
ncbi:hypothetical protein DFH06DRAFT_1299329 [Mycena polygramma]|nr:hypothetical protein DFH06DRAFT_1299329 [Mycena polygramma]